MTCEQFNGHCNFCSRITESYQGDCTICGLSKPSGQEVFTWDEVTTLLEDLSMECNPKTTFPTKLAERAGILLKKMGKL